MMCGYVQALSRWQTLAPAETVTDVQSARLYNRLFVTDRKFNRIKAKDQDEETHTIKDNSQQSVGTPTFADIFKQMEK